MRARSALRTCVVASICAGLLVFGSTQSASAHADYVGSCPGVDEVMSSVDRIEIGLDSRLIQTPATPPTITLVDTASGEAVPIGATTLSRPTVLQSSVSGLAPGAYRVHYKVLSIDGDLNIGDFSFTLDPTSATATDCASAVFEAPDSSSSGSIFVVLAPLTVVAAGLFALSVWARRRASKPAD